MLQKTKEQLSKVQEGALKAREQQKASKAKISELASRLRNSKADLTDMRTKFRNWRCKNPDSDLTDRFKAIAQIPGKKAREEQMQGILDMYATQFAQHMSTRR